MKDYKRLTKWSELRTLHVFDINGKEIPLCDVSPIDTDNLIGRLAYLEEKIESGELCDRKETAREILQKLYRRTRNYHGNRCLLTSKDVIDIAELYGIKLEDEE